MSAETERPARPGEKCSCGRPATVVYITERFGDVGYCGVPGASKLAQPNDAAEGEGR